MPRDLDIFFLHVVVLNLGYDLYEHYFGKEESQNMINTPLIIYLFSSCYLVYQHVYSLFDKQGK